MPSGADPHQSEMPQSGNGNDPKKSERQNLAEKNVNTVGKMLNLPTIIVTTVAGLPDQQQ